jgi:DNA-binding NarL/FixJ family response regulator
VPGAPTAVIVDEWPLVRLGIAQALRAAGVRVAGEAGRGDEGLRLVQAGEAAFLVLGAVRNTSLVDLVRRAGAGDHVPRILVLLDQTSRDELASLASLGVDALLVRSARPEEVADAIGRVEKGERVVAPALLPLLVGALGPAEESAGEEDDNGVLTPKELEVLSRLAEGRSNREIANALYVTPATVKTHLAHIYAKLGVTDRHGALARAVELGLLG